MTTAVHTLTRDEWTRRYAARVECLAGWSTKQARDEAKAAAIAVEQQAKAAGRPAAWINPEDAARDELAFWMCVGDAP